jgi:hypothetical protein
MLSEVFWVAFITTISGMLIKLASMCYKSKCKEVSICCVKIIRDTEAEAKEEEFRLEHPENSSPRGDSTRNINI